MSQSLVKPLRVYRLREHIIVIIVSASSDLILRQNLGNGKWIWQTLFWGGWLGWREVPREWLWGGVRWWCEVGMVCACVVGVSNLYLAAARSWVEC